MRITGVESASLDGSGRASRLLVLRTDTERFGIGELTPCSPDLGSDGTRHGLDALLLGRDPYDTESLLADARNRPGSAPSDDVFLAAAQAAMSDLVGRELGVPVYQLMGGRVRDQVRVCAIDWATGAADDSELVAAARRTVAAGFTALRLDLPAGTAGPPDNRARSIAEAARVVRESVVDEVDLVIDFSGTFSTTVALELARALGPIEPLWLEDPVAPDNPDGLRSIGRGQSIPLAGGRRTDADALAGLASSGLVDHLVLDVARVRGLAEARRIAAMAEIWHVDIVLAVPGGMVALATALQLAAAIPNLAMLEVRPGSVAVRDGMVDVDPRPGLGLGALAVLDGEVSW